MTDRPEYKDPKFKQILKEVRKRDKYRCRFPGCKIKGARRIQVHHIKRYAAFPGLRQNPHNLICLCKKHHKHITGKEAQYEELFFSLLITQNTKDKMQKLKDEENEKIQDNS